MTRGSCAASLLAVAWMLVGSNGWAAGVSWRTDFETARQEAQRSGKLLLVNVHAGWCGPCRRLQQTTLQDPSLLKTIGDYCIPVSLDYDHNQILAQQLGVTSLPAQLSLLPDGRRVGGMEGYADARTYSSALRGAIEAVGVKSRGVEVAMTPLTTPATAARRSMDDGVRSVEAPLTVEERRAPPPPLGQPPRSPARLGDTLVSIAHRDAQTQKRLAKSDSFVTPPTPPIEGRVSPAALPPPSPLVLAQSKPAAPALENLTPRPARLPAPVIEEDNAPIGLQGYCPVSMIQRAELIPGQRSIWHVYQGQRFLFVSAAERSLFTENPERFLPAENGQCVVAWLEENQWRPGVIELPAIFGDHVYFFSSPTMREKFLKDPERYVDRTGRAYREVRDAVLR